MAWCRFDVSRCCFHGGADMVMSPAQMKLLRLLKQRAMSSDELVAHSGLSPDGIRGRLSELRTLHHIVIIKKDGVYSLDRKQRLKTASVAGRILSYITEKSLMGKPIDPETLRDSLRISNRELYDGLSELCRSRQLTQLSKDSIIIGRR
jgi:hypothetical protein